MLAASVSILTTIISSILEISVVIKFRIIFKKVISFNQIERHRKDFQLLGKCFFTRDDS